MIVLDAASRPRPTLIPSIASVESTMTTIAVSGASGRTGWLVVQEAIARGKEVRAILRPGSQSPEGLQGAQIRRLELVDTQRLSEALRGCAAMVIATGARPTVDLLSPMPWRSAPRWKRPGRPGWIGWCW